ncbi:hypothetical protein [Agathobaculum desmolans]|uniref:hypothetical protein n=1 Tax=Agathobaculum desmolans TaxID=39484 RepID=UPI0004E22C71|nr:hypothetical protein [Agathobaculum desmolans]
MYWDIFALLAAAGKNLWFLWPMTFVFGLTSAIFYTHPQAEESEEARDKREKRMLLGELAAGASLIILFCAAIG